MKKLFRLFLASILAPALALGQTVDYQPFANGGFANVESQASYLADLANPSALQNGFQTGIAKSAQVNKVLRQQAVMTSAIANAISQVNGGTNVLDDGNVATLTTAYIKSLTNSNGIFLSSLAGTNTLTATISPSVLAPTAYAAGQRWILFNNQATNTGAVTLNINSIGARPVKKRNNVSVPAPLAPGDLALGSLYYLIDDGSELIVTNVRQYSQFAAIASASTIDLNSPEGDYGHVTGNTTITAISLLQGDSKTVVFDGSPLVTNNANIILPGGANLIAQPGDVITFRGEGAGVVRATAVQAARSNLVTIGSWLPSLGGNTTYVTQTGTYTKIGQEVCIAGQIQVQTLGTGSATSIVNLPFQPSSAQGNLQDYAIPISSFSSAATSVVYVVGRAIWTTNSMNIVGLTAASTTLSISPITFFQNGTFVEFSGCYLSI